MFPALFVALYVVVAILTAAKLMTRGSVPLRPQLLRAALVSAVLDGDTSDARLAEARAARASATDEWADGWAAIEAIAGCRA